MTTALEKRTVVEEVADEIVAAFSSIKGRDLAHPMTSTEIEEMRGTLAKQETYLKSLPKSKLKRLEKRDKKRNEEIAGSSRSACRRVGEALQLLSRETLPRTHDLAGRLVRMFGRISYAYTQTGPSSAEALIGYLKNTSYPHVWWLVKTWIAAAIAIGDYPTAEYLLQVQRESHDWSTNAKIHHPFQGCARAMLALKRDGDIEKAIEIAGRVKGAYGDEDSTRLFAALEAVSAGRHPKLLAEKFQPIALLTGDWNGQKAKARRKK